MVTVDKLALAVETSGFHSSMVSATCKVIHSAHTSFTNVVRYSKLGMRLLSTVPTGVNTVND